ncbi:MAG: hypothetical protein KGL39_17240 [Patescibacteria group bacterium]|nr:hypothetical protein [Patescibacteria group bacterium]
MTASLTLFANNATPTGQELDDNFTCYTPLSIIPCTVSGTNTLTLTPHSGTSGATPTIAAYQNYMQFSGVFANNGSGALFAAVGSLASLNVYKDTPSGPVATDGTEALKNNAFTVIYDSTLNGGAGGWHLYTKTGGFNGGTITNTLAVQGGSLGVSLTSTLLTGNSLTITAQNITGATLSITSLASVTKLEVGASASSLTRLISGSGTVTYTVSNASGTQDQNFTLSGAQVGDSLALGFGPSIPAGAGFTGFMAAAGTVTLRLINPSTVTLGAATLTVRATAIGFT